jgi:1,4-alpha-glucan branching enzyme
MLSRKDFLFRTFVSTNQTQMKTLRLLLLTALIIAVKTGLTQVIISTPAFPTDNDSCILIYDAALGNGELKNVAPPIYAHTGVITNLSSSPTDWKYVVAGWSENTPKALMTPLGNNKYQLKVKPAIRSYYGVPASEQIEKMAFVFRNADGTKVGRNSDGSDIYADVYSDMFSVNIVLPENKALLVKLNDPIPVYAVSPLADSMKILLNGITVKSLAGTSITETLTVGSSAANWIKQWVKVVAINNTGSVADSFSYAVIPMPAVAPLPAGIHDGINYTDSTTVVLSLYAPGKDNVFVTGDFNSWTLDSAGYMYKTPDGNRFWLQIGNLVPRQEYIFQYLVDGTLHIGDPYADKVSDPDDQYISPETYPNLKPYPAGKANGVATYLQTAQDPYPWDTAAFHAPKVTDLFIYELLIRDFTIKHDYPSLIDTLDYLKRLGVNAIELMPVMEFEGNNSWGYNPDYSFAVDKYYGTKNGLKQFVEAAHARGIAVILDIVCNHHFGKSPLVRLYWNSTSQQPAPNNPWFNQVPKHPYNVGYDFNHESFQTRTYMERLIKYWVQEFHVDGYRFDLSKGFTQTNTYPNNVGLWGNYDAGRISILRNYANTFFYAKPDGYMILEHFADNSEETVLAADNMLLWGNITGAYQEGAMGYNSNGKSDFSWASYQKRGWSNPNVVAYMESHDEERMMYKNETWGNATEPPYSAMDTATALHRMELAATFFFTIPGPKMIWQFGELGYDYSINYPTGTSESRLAPKPIRWDYYTNEWRRHYVNIIFSALAGLKTTEPAFETTDFTIDAADAVKRIILRHSTMDVTVLGNFDVTEQSVVPGFTKTGMWYEFFSGDSLNVANVDAPLAFKPGEYRLYTTRRLPKPQYTGINETPADKSHGGVIVYPNPSNGIFHFELLLQQTSEISVQLYSSQGHLIKSEQVGSFPAGLRSFEVDFRSATSGLPGLYFYRLDAGANHSSGKLFIR